MGAEINRKTLLAYGTLGFPIAVLSYPMTLFLHPHCAEELGLGFGAIGTVLLVSRMTDFVTDPLMGWISDRTRTRFGRRKQGNSSGSSDDRPIPSNACHECGLAD